MAESKDESKRSFFALIETQVSSLQERVLSIEKTRDAYALKTIATLRLGDVGKIKEAILERVKFKKEDVVHVFEIEEKLAGVAADCDLFLEKPEEFHKRVQQETGIAWKEHFKRFTAWFVGLFSSAKRLMSSEEKAQPEAQSQSPAEAKAE